VDSEEQKQTAQRDEFLERASRGSSGILGEYIDFLRFHRKWWLAPIIMGLLIVGIMVVVGGTAAAPLIYALF
jgi:hypothetical protein